MYRLCHVIRQLDYAKVFLVKTMQIVWQLVHFSKYLLLTVHKCELVFLQVPHFGNFLLNENEWLLSVDLKCFHFVH